MGRSVTPTFRVEVTANVHITDMFWSVKQSGKPTAENAEKFRKMLNESFAPGGVNAPKGDEIVPHISKVRVIRQSTNAVVAEASAPLFEVV